MKHREEILLGTLYALFGLFGILAGSRIYSQDPDAWRRLVASGYGWVFALFVAGFLLSCINALFGISIALRRPWTRKLAGYAVSIVNLVALFPLGTLLGILSLCWQMKRGAESPDPRLN